MQARAELLDEPQRPKHVWSRMSCHRVHCLDETGLPGHAGICCAPAQSCHFYVCRKPQCPAAAPSADGCCAAATEGTAAAEPLGQGEKILAGSPCLGVLQPPCLSCRSHSMLATPLSCPLLCTKALPAGSLSAEVLMLRHHSCRAPTRRHQCPKWLSTGPSSRTCGSSRVS